MRAPILIVDDERDFAELLSMRLSVREIETVCAFDGESALKLVAQGGIELVILDLNLPGMDGLAVLAEIKREHPEVEVVMLTGDTAVQRAVEGMKLGALDYLIKPVDVTVLISAVNLARQRKSGRFELRRMRETGKLAAIGALAEGVAHEIANPVNIMVNEAGWLEELVEEEPSESNLAELRRLASEIKTQGGRCKHFLAKLLSLGGRVDPRPAQIDLNAFLDRLLCHASSRAGKLSVNILREFSPGLPELTAAPAELEQVFVNLIDNALDSMQASGGKLTAQTAFENGMLKIVLSDTGQGIPKADLLRVFEPFYSTKEVGQASGLGLSICRNILSVIGGDIELGGELGRGVSATVRLPLKAVQIADARQPEDLAV